MKDFTKRNLFMILFLIVIIMVAVNSSVDEIKSEVNEYKVKELTDYQKYITQKGGTEQPFENEFWNNKEAGIYVDIVSGEPLFSSLDKYDSGTGWPSFTKPLEEENIVTRKDTSLDIERTEVKSVGANSHLGHVFDDGPNGGNRFCINSASLKFIPAENLKKEGYGDYVKLFE